MSSKIWNQVHFMPVMSLACNASCSYCFGPNKGETMSSGMLKHVTGFMHKVVNETGQSHVNITFHGGEPLMAGLALWEQALSGIREAFGDHKTTLNIQSNLWNLSDETCSLFKEYGVSIGTSLDGPEEINDLQRGEGYYKNTMHGIKRAVEHQLKPGCICTFTPENIAKYEEVFRFFVNEQLSFSMHGTLPSINGSRGRHSLSPETYGNLLCMMLDLYVRYRHYIQISSLDQLIISLVEREGQVCSFKDCFGMFMAIDPGGNIYPCQRFCGNRDYVMGNVLTDPSLEELMDSPVARKFMERQEAVKGRCGTCKHYTYCKGGCTYNAWAGEDAVDPYCESYKMAFEKIEAGLMSEMQTEENIQAIARNPFISKTQNPLLRKGALTELTRKDAHPVNMAGNAIKILSYVALAENDSKETAVDRLKSKGLRINVDYLRRIQTDLNRTNSPLNNLYIHLTYQCQLSCNHCYATVTTGKQEVMPVDEVMKLVNDARSLNFRQVVLTGGEPLLHPGLDSLLKQLEQKKKQLAPLHLVLRSNFVKKLREEEHKQLARAFSKIIVSVDGSRESHDRRRGAGAYDATIRNLELYQDIAATSPSAAELSLSCTLSNTKGSEDIRYSVKELTDRLGIRQVRFRPVLPLGNAENWDIPPVSEAISSYQDTEEVLIHGFSPVISCGIGQNLYVGPEGSAFPCYAYKEKHSFLGNVLREGLEKVIRSDKFTDLRDHTVDTNPKCRQCRYRYLCGGACRAWGGEETRNNLDAPPPECEGLYRQAGRIYLEAINYLKNNNLLREDPASAQMEGDLHHRGNQVL